MFPFWVHLSRLSASHGATKFGIRLLFFFILFRGMRNEFAFLLGECTTSSLVGHCGPLGCFGSHLMVGSFCLRFCSFRQVRSALNCEVRVFAPPFACKELRSWGKEVRKVESLLHILAEKGGVFHSFKLIRQCLAFTFNHRIKVQGKGGDRSTMQENCVEAV